MRQSPLKPKSTRQIERDTEWRKVKHFRANDIAARYGFVICEYCGRPHWNNELGQFDAHHIDHNRRNNTLTNCYIVHRVCHREIHDKGIKVKPLDFQGIKQIDEV